MMLSMWLLLICALVLAAVSASIFDYDVMDADGNTVSLSKYKDARAILIGKHGNVRRMCL